MIVGEVITDDETHNLLWLRKDLHRRVVGLTTSFLTLPVGCGTRKLVSSLRRGLEIQINLIDNILEERHGPGPL